MTTTKPSKNATSHGAYSCEVVLPWENVNDFNNLHKSFKEELYPVGAMEEAAVLDLASLHWKKLRLNLGSQLAFRRTSDATALAQAGRSNGWEGIADHFAPSVQDAENMRARVRDVVKAWSKAAAAVGDCLAKQIERELAPAVPPNAPTSGEPPAPDAAQSAAPANAPDQERNPSYDEVKKLNLLLKEMQICSHQIAPTLRIIEKADLDASLSERAYQPEILERELKLHADIDKRIEKTIARLIGLKEYKRMYTPKLVNATPAAATSGVPGSQASPVTTPSGMLP